MQNSIAILHLNSTLQKSLILMFDFEGDEALPLEKAKRLIRTDTRKVTRQCLSSAGFGDFFCCEACNE